MAVQTVSDTLDCIDSLNQKLAQLNAMLTMSYGEAGDAFRTMNGSLQDNFLWACSTLASECKELALGLSPASVDCRTVHADKQEIAHA